MNSTLEKIVAKAKKLKKQAPNKFAKWTDYVKEASKQIKPVIKKAKKTAKKVIGYKKDRLAILKTTTPIIKAYRKDRKYSRKDAIKNALIDASFVSGTHTDKNSHNVKLAIYSGLTDKLNFNEKVGIIYAHMKIVQNKIINRQKLSPYEETLFKYISSHGFHLGSKKAVRDKII